MNKELVHNFIKFVMENYGIRLIASESPNGDTFESLFPDLVEVLEKENEDNKE